MMHVVRPSSACSSIASGLSNWRSRVSSSSLVRPGNVRDIYLMPPAMTASCIAPGMHSGLQIADVSGYSQAFDDQIHARREAR